ncbi:MAG TPA: phosphodiester glycosidase family protein [Firmicutes bacterium]|nr:phosphodiester glycosidase family protein [Bacillota bacterium]
MGTIERLRFVLMMLIFSLIVLGQAAAEELTFSVDQSQAVLRVHVPEGSGYRVWQNTNPMKVIVDLDHQLAGLPINNTVNDVALKAVRASKGPGTIGTRVVMEFAFLMPDVKWELDGSWLKVTVNKLYAESTITTVSHGVRYGHMRKGIAAGPLIINYLEIRYADPLVEVRSVLSQDQVYGRELVSSMARRSKAIAAANGLFFASDGRPLGLLAIDGRIISEPYANRTAIGIKPGQIVIDQVSMNGKAILSDGREFAVSGINRPRLADELIIYTPDYGETSRTNVYGVDLIVVDDIVVDIVNGAAVIPPNGYVLSGHGAARDFLNQVAVDDQITVELKLNPDWLEQGFVHIIGGGPRLVKDGKVYITAEEERFQPDIAAGRAPRTALGVTADRKLLIVTVNGRQPGVSVGMTLTELAELMIELGAVDAMNLDGGGSTTMVIRDRVLNIPSDGTERSVSNAIVVITPESRE